MFASELESSVFVTHLSVEMKEWWADVAFTVFLLVYSSLCKILEDIEFNVVP